MKVCLSINPKVQKYKDEIKEEILRSAECNLCVKGR